jgi:hypothetical protein
MERTPAIALTVLIFFSVWAISYMYAKLSFFCSFILAILLSLVVLNIAYPPTKVSEDGMDGGFYVYAIIQLGGLIILGVYILFSCLGSRRMDYVKYHNKNNPTNKLC